jgi:glucan phosphorylase
MSIIEGTPCLRSPRIHTLTLRRAEGNPKSVRMMNLAVVGSRKVNGVAEVSTLHICGSYADHMP